MGNKQHLEQVLAAADLAQNRAGPAASNVRFALMGDGSQRPYLEAEARNRTLKNVMFLPPEPDATYPDVLAAADVLLVAERASVVDMALPSKLTSYAAVGRPVIAAVNPSGATAREVERAGFGIIVAAEQPDRLIESINQLVSDSEAVDRLGAAGRTFAASSLDVGAALRQAEAMVAAIAGDRGHKRPRALGTAT
jgi:glycosyltransferase involved in cell wall biosynthesis